MRIKHDGVAGGADVTDVAASTWNRMRAGRESAPTTPNGVYSSQRDAVVRRLRASGRSQSTPGTSFNQSQLGDLVIEPADLGLFKFDLAPRLGIFLCERLDDFLNLAAGGNAFFLQLQKRFLRRLTRFFRRGNTPNLPRKAGAAEVFLTLQPHESDFGAGAGAGEGLAVAVAVPPSLPSTSATTSRIKVSFTALIVQSTVLCAKNFFSKNVHAVHEADDDGVHGCVLHAGREARGTALAKTKPVRLHRHRGRPRPRWC